MSDPGGRFAVHWPAPQSVRVVSTTRRGGSCSGPYASFNLSTQVGDDPAIVRRNRATLRECCDLEREPSWLNQVHGECVIRAHDAHAQPAADGSWTDRPGFVCAVLTADCLPIVLCDQAGSCVAVLHAGWRGLAHGIIEAGVATLPVEAGRLMAWLGPAIGPQVFEVGEKVRREFNTHDPMAFRPAGGGKWFADLHRLARERLESVGVVEVHGETSCTFSNAETFFSHRRDPLCGRQATLAWIDRRRVQ